MICGAFDLREYAQNNLMKDKKRENGSTAVDPRFAAARTDPRFQRFPKSQRKVEIDERFAGETFR